MIAYLARTLPVALRARRRKADRPLVSRIRRRVHPRDIDLNFHMNQAVYPQVMELGRTEWVIACGAWEAWSAVDVKPVVAEQTIVYRRELKTFAAYEIDSRAVRG